MEVVKVENDFNSVLTFDCKSLDELTSSERFRVLKTLCNNVRKKDTSYIIDVLADIVLSLYADEELCISKNDYIHTYKYNL